MWSSPEEPPGTMEEGPPEPVSQATDKCEQNKSQLESLKEIMLRNQQSLKKKEEEVQEYGRRLSKIKSRTKLARRSKETASSPKDPVPKDESTLPDMLDQAVDDISQAKTPKAKSTLLQKKLAENRKAFEQRSKEITESKRAVEEKVEAIRQQLHETDAGTMGYKEQLPVTPIKSLAVTSDIQSPQQIAVAQEKDSKIVELSNKILELEATLLDLQENLKEKDSVINAKTMAVTLMSADLSKKGKTTLDALEETKDEMRTMQEHFILLETSLKDKNENLLEQLKERNDKIATLEETVVQFEQQINEQEKSASATVDFSRSTMDTLVETKDAMKSMQENFVLIESSLKSKNDNLLQQLEAYEIKVAEANERIFQLESGMGIVKDPSIDNLQFKINKLELRNKQLEDEKYELQKSVAEMQNTIVNRSIPSDGALIEKDNRIAELENLVIELKQSNKFLEEESKAELQKQLADVTLKNEQYFDKINDLEKSVNDLETERSNLIARLPDETAAGKEDEKIVQLTKELEELNKTMIKIKAQHRSKVKNLQKQLENFKGVSDANAELVRLGNQVALLEEEKGNLQLSLVDFDELKASTGDLQEYVADLESKVSAQTKEIQTHIEAIAILENQKLDLTQELHLTKQEISALEAENAESENLRVTAEMKVVDLEEQLDSFHKIQKEGTNNSFSVSQPDEFLKKIADLTHENNVLYNKLSKLEEKVASDSGSTESFEAIQELDKIDLLKKVEDLMQRNSELMEKLNKLEEKSNSHGGSTDSFEAISDGDKTVLLRRIDQLTQENSDLMMKLSRIEEKGSSDTGSTESFERIPEHSESTNKIEFLTQENHELLEKLAKLEEQVEHLQICPDNNTKFESVEKAQLDIVLQEKNLQSEEMQMLKEKIVSLSDEIVTLETRVEALVAENTKLISLQAQHEDSTLEETVATVRKRSASDLNESEDVDILLREKILLEKQVKELRNAIEQSSKTSSDETDANSAQIQVETLTEENMRVLKKVDELEYLNKNLKDELNDVTREKDELLKKIDMKTLDTFVDERRELIDKLEKLNVEKENVARERQDLQEQINAYLHKPNEESLEVPSMDDASQNMEAAIVASLEKEIEDSKKLIAEQADLIEEMKLKLSNKEMELNKKREIIEEYESSGKKTESLEQDLKEMLNTVEEWKYKCYDMESKMDVLEAGKASIEEGLHILQREHDSLLEKAKEKEASSSLMKEELQSTIDVLEKRLQEMTTEFSAKEQEVANLKEAIESKNEELDKKYAELQNEMITVDNLQDEVTYCTALIQEKQNALSSLNTELEELKEMLRNRDDEIYSLRREVAGFHEKLQNSKSVEEYNSLAQAYERKESMLHEMECEFDEYKKEGSEISMKLQRLLVEKDDLETQISKKQHEYVDVVKEKEDLEGKFAEVQTEKSNAERRIYELQSILDNNAKFVDDLQQELKDTYKQIEQLKLKHTEDMEMQNQRLELLIEELNTKTHENDIMKIELEEKERLVGQNITEESKIALEAQVTSLEEKLAASEDKIQAQIEKMKKIAANLKRKTNLCQELEARIAELEEKLTSEKDEKEAKNRQIQDVEIIMRDKDNRITDLHDKLAQARAEASETAINLEKVNEELANAKEKMLLVTEQIAEMGEEVIRLRAEVDARTTEYAAEKDAKEAVQKAFEAYRQEILEENQRKELKLEEVTETARELRVRMDVMEQEYVEHLALISNLKTENGLLLSKQAQINEKLENVEKESDERRILIEQLQARVVHTVDVGLQAFEDHITESESEVSGMRHSNNSEECQALISALEAKLQDRDAELKKLGNGLADAINKLVEIPDLSEIQDTSHEIDVRNRTLIEKVEELVNQYKALEQFNEETTVKWTDAVTETNRLRADIETLQSLNGTLEEKLKALQEELYTERMNVNIVETMEPTKAEMYDKQLLSLQEKLEVDKMQADQLHQELNLQIAQLQSEKQQLSEREESLRHTQASLEEEVKNLKIDKSAISEKMTDLKTELERYKRETQQTEEPSAVSLFAPALEGAVDDQDNVPQLFDASKIFGSSYASEPDILTSNEMAKLQNELRERESYCSNLTKEIDNLKKQIAEERLQLVQDCNRCSEELRVTQDRLSTAQADVERFEKLITEKNVQIDSLNTELSNVDLQIMAQCNQPDESDTKLEELVSLKDNQINELKAELTSTTEILEVLTAERDQQVRQSESNRVQIANLEAELRNSNDTELIQELEKKISDTLKERDLLQLQVNDLTRSMEELQNTIESQRNLQMEIETTLREKAEATEMVANLMRALEEVQKGSAELKSQEKPATQEPITELLVASPYTAAEQSTGVESLNPSGEASEEVIDLDAGSAFNVDEEMWDWNADVIQLVDQEHVAPLIPSEEAKLRAQVGDLEDRIKELEIEKERITEESKAAQVRSGKLVKKLKEYKVQVENLQQQLKIQKSASEFYELDSAIEEELKAQISKLEKALNDSKENQKGITAEKEGLLKRLDVLTSANERYLDLKEKQDLEMEVLRIQNKELTNKMNALDLRLQDSNGSTEAQMLQRTEQVTDLMQESTSSKADKQLQKRSVEEHSELAALYKKSKDELDDLKDQMEALAIENEQLQQTLENLKDTQDQQQANEKNSSEIIRELTNQCSKLQDALDQSGKQYEHLQEQYEQCVLNANDRVAIVQQNADALRLETQDQINKLNVDILNLQEKWKESNERADVLQSNLENSVQEKSKLEEKVAQLFVTEEGLAAANSSLAEVTDLLNARIQEVADLKQELQKQYIDWEDRELKLQSTIELITLELNEKRQELDSLRRSLNDKENELVQRQGVETVSVIVSQATQELMQKHAIEIEEKDNEIRSLREKAATLQIAVDEYSLDMQSNIAKLESQQQEFDLMKQNILQKDSLLLSIQNDLQSAQATAMQNEMELSKQLNTSQVLTSEKEQLLQKIDGLEVQLNEAKTTVNAEEYKLHINNLKLQLQNLTSVLAEKQLIIEKCELDLKEFASVQEVRDNEIKQLQEEIGILKNGMRNKTEEISNLKSELDVAREALDGAKRNLEEKSALLEKANQSLRDRQSEFNSSFSSLQSEGSPHSNIVDGLPLFRMGDNESEKLQSIIDALRSELQEKLEEIEHLKYILSENTYPSILQELQERINLLYNEKAGLESSLEIATHTVADKERTLSDLRERIEIQSQEFVSKEEASALSRDPRSIKDQEEIVRLQNELHAKEQSINDLKYIISEKDSQLSLQASMEPQSDDYELGEIRQRLYIQEQEIEHLKRTIVDLQTEISRLAEFETLSTEYRIAIEKLSAEKEYIRIEGEEFLEKKLKEKEFEIDEIKQKLIIENQKILEQLQLREKDLENFKLQFEESLITANKLSGNLQQKEQELMQVHTELAEKERRLAELSITKDTELHNLKVQIQEKEVRIEELAALSEEEEKQLLELRSSLDARETEINALKKLLEDKIKEYELIQHALKKDVPIMGAPSTYDSASDDTSGDGKEFKSHELDVALYMLHQRDVRCEELTHELMQLLEERDTLQLRLSNAIRVNEELRRVDGTETSLKIDAPSTSSSEDLLVEHPSPSKSEGPVEIAKEAIDAPIGEDKEALALNTRRSQSVERSTELALGEEHPESSPYVMNE